MYNVNRMTTSKLFFHSGFIGFDKRTLLASYIWWSVRNREKCVTHSGYPSTVTISYFIFRTKVLFFQTVTHTRMSKGSERSPPEKNVMCAAVSKIVNYRREIHDLNCATSGVMSQYLCGLYSIQQYTMYTFRVHSQNSATVTAVPNDNNNNNSLITSTNRVLCLRDEHNYVRGDLKFVRIPNVTHGVTLCCRGPEKNYDSCPRGSRLQWVYVLCPQCPVNNNNNNNDNKKKTKHRKPSRVIDSLLNVRRRY